MGCRLSAFTTLRVALLTTLPFSAAAFAQTEIHRWDGAPGQPQLLGTSVAGTGDLNGDGHDDILVGLPGVGIAASGMARLHSGADGSVLLEWSTPFPNARLGWSVAALHDVDGDGTADVLIGAPQGVPYSNLYGSGFVDLCSGADGRVIRRFYGQAFGDLYGFCVAALGDLDGDGVPEFAIGAPYHDTTKQDAGMVEIRSGAHFGVLRTITGTTYEGHLGYSVADAGDVDADGTPDVIVGEPEEFGVVSGGHARVYSGADGAELLVFTGGGYDHFLGHSVSGAGDVDRDGHADLLIGLPGKSRARVCSGATGALLFEMTGAPGSDFGSALGLADDLDGDGQPDFVIGAPGDDFPTAGGVAQWGSVSFHSSADGSLLWRFFAPGGQFGRSVGLAGDIDGDGHRDLVVGAPQSSKIGLGGIGRAYAFSLHPWTGLGSSLAGSGGLPALWGQGLPVVGEPLSLHLAAAKPAASVTLVIGLGELSLPFQGGVLVPSPDVLVPGLVCNAAGSLVIPATWPAGVPAGIVLRFQAWMADAAGPSGFAASNGLSLVAP